MKAKHELKAIIFDWGGVLCTGANYLAHPVLSKNSKIKVEEINKIFKKSISDFYKGKIQSKKFWDTLVKKTNISGVNSKALSKAYIDSYKIYLGMFKLLKKLSKNYKIGLLSNLTKEMKNHIIYKHKINKYFDYLVFSCDNGFMKPDKKAFNYILKRMKVSATQAVFIDDTKENINIAHKMGFKTILFTSEEQCKSQLDDLLSKY